MAEPKYLSDFAYDLAQWLKNGQKVFFLMGAGCSYYNGIPLMNGFLDTAAINFPNEWNELSKFLSKVRKASDTIHTNFYNIEELMTLIETYKIFDEDESNRLTNEVCLPLIKKVIDLSVSNYLLQIENISYKPYSNELGCSGLVKYNSLSHFFLEQISLPKYTKGGALENNKFFIATFNYDDLLSSLPVKEFPPEKQRCFNTPLQLKELIEGIKTPYSNNRISVNSPVQVSCLHGSIHENNIIPPTQNKIFSDSKVKKAWQESKEFLHTADHLVVCGYSMPITDTFFSHFLTLARMDSDKPLRITVINPDPTGEVQARFEKVLSKGILDTGRVKFISGEDGKFENLFCNLSQSINNRHDTKLNEFEGVIRLKADSPILNELSKKFGV